MFNNFDIEKFDINKVLIKDSISNLILIMFAKFF